MPKFNFSKLSQEDRDLLLKGHGKYVAACGHVLAQHGKEIKVPLMIRCSKCDPEITLEDHYAAVNEVKATFRNKRAKIMRTSAISEAIRKCATDILAAGPGRVNTKDHKPLATVIQNMKSKSDITDFMLKVNEMAKPEDNDSDQDRLIKRVYRAFLDDLKKKSIDTPNEIMKTNKKADELIAEISHGAKPVEHLVKSIERYKSQM